MWKEAAVLCFEILSWHLPRGTSNNWKSLSGYPVSVQTPGSFLIRSGFGSGLPWQVLPSTTEALRTSFLSQSDLLRTCCRCRRLSLYMITLSDTHSVGLLYTRDRPAAETLLDNTQRWEETDIASLPAGLEPALPASERPQAYAATGITSLV
jgi:hypothetical protein